MTLVGNAAHLHVAEAVGAELVEQDDHQDLADAHGRAVGAVRDARGGEHEPDAGLFDAARQLGVGALAEDDGARSARPMRPSVRLMPLESISTRGDHEDDQRQAERRPRRVVVLRTARLRML